MTTPQLEFGIDEYFRTRLMPIGDVQLQLQSSLAEFASPLHWMECRRPLSRIDPAYSCLP